MAEMVAAGRPIRSKVLANRTVPFAKRVIWLRALLFSKGLFQAAVWPTLTSAELKVVHCAVVKVMRMVHFPAGPIDFADSASSADVIRALGLPAPVNLLRTARLDLFVRLLVKPSPILLSLLFVARNAKRSWVKAVHADLAFAAKFSKPLARLSAAPVSQWAIWILRDPVKAKRVFHDALQSKEANMCEVWGFSKSLREIDLVVACDGCSATFKSRQALAVHRYKVHGWRHPAHAYAVGTHCTVCLLEFWHRHRLLAHLMDKSQVCMSNLVLRSAPMSCDAIAALDDAAKIDARNAKHAGRRRGWASKPCVRLLGPLLPILGADQESAHPLGVGNRWHVV